jgi:predicted secreted protein
MAEIAYQIQLWVGATEVATTATVQIAEVNSINLPAISVDEQDVTHMGSPNWLREYLPGLVDQSQISVDMNYVQSSPTDDLLRTMAVGRQIRFWEIRFTAPATDIVFAGRAFITNYEPGTQTVGEKMTGALALRCTTLWAEVV